MTLPQASALGDYYQRIPPPAMQLQRIARYLGLPDPKPVQTSAQTPEDAIRAARSAGLPVMEGRPNDPMLDLLD